MSGSVLPVDQVKGMQAQGLSNNQIIQTLQRDGFNATQIFDAMNQATLSSTSPRVSTPPSNQGENTMNQYPPTPTSPPPAPAPVPTPVDTGATEEMVEAIIDEKWNELVKDINTIIEWKNQAQTTIVSLEQQFTDLKSQFDKLHQALIAKIGEYDKNILDVGAEIKAMEKVFSKVLPTFTENVASLSKITKDMKSTTKENSTSSEE